MLPSTAQFEKVKGVIIKKSKLSLLGKSRPIADLVKMKPTSKARAEEMDKQKKKPNNFLGRLASKVVYSRAEHQGVDLLRQVTQGAKLGAKALVNVDGLGEFNSPHDPTGDVGRNHYVQMINATTVGVFSKDGSLLETFAANTLWEEFGAESAGDPIVLYDEVADRWFITEFTDPENVLIAVSDSGDPLGAYYAYNFSTPSFPDYPKYAIWPEALVLTTNEGGAGVLEQYFFDKQAMLQGLDEVNMQRIEIPGNNNIDGGFFVSTPVDWNGSMLPENINPIVLSLEDSSWGKVQSDQINVYRIIIDWNDVNNTFVEKIDIKTSPYDAYPCSQTSGPGFSCVPQKGGSGLDALPEVIMNIPHYRNFGTHESMVFSFITDVTDGKNLSGIRWIELRRTKTQDWSLYQEGTYAPDDDKDRYMSSIAIDRQGNIGLAYNISSANDFVGIRYTGRHADDALGVMTMEEVTAIDGKGTISSGGRFGDYAQMSVDPVEDVFWYTSEYASTGLESRTRIIAFQISKDTYDLAAVTLVSPVTKANLTNAETVTIAVENKGLVPVKDFTVGYAIDGVAMDSMKIDQDIAPNNNGQYSFAKKADLSLLPSSKTFEVWVRYPLDKNTSNDRLVKEVSHIYEINAAMVAAAVPNFICDSTIDFIVEVKNLGALPLDSVEFHINTHSNDYIFQIKLDKPLDYNLKDSVLVTLPVKELGAHDINILLTKANGIAITDPSNVPIVKKTNQMGYEARYILRIAFDKFPEENKWNIRYKVGNEFLYNVGPYTVLPNSIVNETVCLAKDTCYRFSFRDDSANGICCSNGNGNLSFTKASTGELKFESDGKFKFSYNNNFCTKINCALTLDVTTMDDNGSGDGTISITAKDETGPFKYSIDGGLTFSDNALFANLKAGVYQVVVLGGNPNCKATQSVEVKFTSASQDYKIANKITIKPNPNNGYFQMELAAPANAPTRISYDVLDATGKVLYNRWMNKYNDQYESAVSIVDYPSGIYFLKVNGGTWSRMSRVVKE